MRSCSPRDVIVGDAGIEKMPGKLLPDEEPLYRFEFFECYDHDNTKTPSPSYRNPERISFRHAQDTKSLHQSPELIKALTRFPIRGTNFTSSCTERPGTWSSASAG